jgi:cytochrome c553
MTRLKITWKRVLIVIVLLPVAAFLAAWSGLFNIAASTGHWRITDWFLHFAMQSSVRTYAWPVEAPDPLPQEGLVAAAGHFETGCAVCHASPGTPRDAWVLEMLPHPPKLAPVLSSDKWTDEQLFRIVKHGVRFTGMPAWPTQERDDEIWAMVAFLRELPELEPAEYRDLAFGTVEPQALAPTTTDLDAAIADCARCHGEDGIGRGEAVPILAGQHEAYLEASLEAYANGWRHSGVMEMAALDADAELYDDLADYFASLPASSTPTEADPALIDKGRALAENGIPTDDIPRCGSCHAKPEANPRYPKLAGQKEYYLKTQLELFAAEKRGGTPLHDLMHEFAHKLEPEQIEALAAYYASLPAE